MMELVLELATFERAPQEVTVSQQHFEDSGFGENPVWWAFVAEDNEKIVALALYYIRYSTWKGRRLYLEDLIVTEVCRGQGIGKMLFDRTLHLSRKRKYYGMVWQVLNWNEPAINFYKKYNAEFDNEWVNVEINE